MPADAVNRRLLWAALALTAAKVWLTGGQTIYAIGPAIHDDKLFLQLADHLLAGNWLGPYNQFTLAKGPLFSVFLAGVFWLGLPLLLAQQLVYAGACAAVTRALAPWLRSGWSQFTLYVVLLANPMSYDAGNLSRLMRQNIYTPLALLVFAGLVTLYARRRESGRRQAGPAILAGLALGLFWITREESVWLLPAVGLALLGLVASLRGEWSIRWRPLVSSFSLLLLTALLPLLVVCTLNWRHYGWFGSVEFRASEFKAAYGALTRLQAGPKVEHVTITRQMREAAYEHSPAFARIRPHFEGEIGQHWFDASVAPLSERQIRGGWFMWAMRDAVAAAGLAPSAGEALRYYQQVADEINAACDAGRVPSLPRRSGFLPPLDRDSFRPILDGALLYADYFIGFKGFTAHSLDSVGDYAELKPFRDLVGTRLSHAPRSPDPFPPNQGVLAGRQVQWLHALGLGTATVLRWLGPVLLLVGLARLIEALVTRRVTFLLGLAAALLASCLAYFAINVLVHVTSFYNMTPAAMAAAYPLYLLALVAIGADAATAWTATPAPGSAAAPVASRRWRGLIAAGAALVVIAARLREIHLFASDVPFNDQWIIEAEQLIAPWLHGVLRPWVFLMPHFEHLPVWTRLLSWVQVAITERWDPLVQMTVNAALHGGFIWLATRWAWQSFSPRPAAFATVVLLLGGALPFAWENIAWGFQSQFPLALIFLVLHVVGACTHPAGSRAWWWAQVAGLAGLFTLASMWLAPLAVVAAHLWSRHDDRREWAVPAAIALLGAALLAIIHLVSPAGHSFAHAARSPLELVHSALHLLGWPSVLPGAAALVQLPWLLHAVRLRASFRASDADRVIFALGLWNAAHALGLAFARTGDSADHVSRYGDLFFIGVLAGSLALARLVASTPRRPIYLLGAFVWCALVAAGLVERATEGHARYFHENAAKHAALRRDAVQAYLARGDRTLLEQEETRWVLTQSTDVLTTLLDQPAFRVLLPASVHPANPEHAAGRLSRGLQSHWPWLAGAGVLLLLVGVGVVATRGSPAPTLATLPIWAGRGPAWFALAVGVASALGLSGWNSPLAFDRNSRWQELLGGNAAITGVTFAFTTPSEFGPERLQGAAPLSPIEVRNRFYGTAPAGPAFTGTVLSSPFVLTKPRLVVPIAGYPTGDGNGLRLRLLDANGEWHGEEIGCPGPNQDGIAYWMVDVTAHVGRSARLVLYDGRAGVQGWVAAAPPIPTDNPALAAQLAQRLQLETHGRLHASLGVIALVSFLVAFAFWRSRPPSALE